MLDTKSAISKRALLFAAAILIPAAAEATTTVTAEATIWQYRDQNFTGNYQPSAIFGEHYGMVGNIVGDIGTNHALDGAYASTIEFVLPDLPDGAMITSASFSIIADYAHRGGDEQIRAYLAADSVSAPSRLSLGTPYTVFNGTTPNTFAPFDVTGFLDVIYRNGAVDPTDAVLGFSFVPTNDDPGTNYLGNSFDSSAGNGPPILTISYDVPTPPPPPPPSAVPEPASWMMFIGGFGLSGAVLRDRRRARIVFAR